MKTINSKDKMEARHHSMVRTNCHDNTEHTSPFIVLLGKAQCVDKYGKKKKTVVQLKATISREICSAALPVLSVL